MSMSCCCDNDPPAYTCVPQDSPWQTPQCPGGSGQCPKGWFVWSVSFYLCEPVGADCNSTGTCPAGPYSFIVAWNGSAWIRPIDSSTPITVEDRDNGDGTFSYRITGITYGGASYTINADGKLEADGDSTCCIISLAIGFYVTRRIWDATTIASETVTLVQAGFADGDDVLNGNCHSCISPDAANINNYTQTLTFYSASILDDGFYMTAVFTGTISRTGTGVGGSCTDDCGDEPTYTCSGSAMSFTANAARFTGAAGNSGVFVPLATAQYGHRSSQYVCTCLGEGEPAYFCCYDNTSNGLGLTANIVCSSSAKTALDPIVAAEWSTINPFAVACVDATAGTLTVAE